MHALHKLYAIQNQIRLTKRSEKLAKRLMTRKIAKNFLIFVIISYRVKTLLTNVTFLRFA